MKLRLVLCLGISKAEPMQELSSDKLSYLSSLKQTSEENKIEKTSSSMVFIQWAFTECLLCHIRSEALETQRRKHDPRAHLEGSLETASEKAQVAYKGHMSQTRKVNVKIQNSGL